jgi:hypothetical protein
MTHNPVDDILLRMFPLPRGPVLGPLTEETYQLAERMRVSLEKIQEAVDRSDLSEYWRRAWSDPYGSDGGSRPVDAGERHADRCAPGGIGGG